jgi:hypothetical protein
MQRRSQDGRHARADGSETRRQKQTHKKKRKGKNKTNTQNNKPKQGVNNPKSCNKEKRTKQTVTSLLSKNLATTTM